MRQSTPCLTLATALLAMSPLWGADVEACIAQALAAEAAKDQGAAILAWRAAVAAAPMERQRVRWVRRDKGDELSAGYCLSEDGAFYHSVFNKGHDDDIVRVNLATGEDLWRSPVQPGWWLHAMAADRERVLTIDGSALVVLDPATGAQRDRIPHDWGIDSRAMWNMHPLILAAPGCPQVLVLGVYEFKGPRQLVAVRFDLAAHTATAFELPGLRTMRGWGAAKGPRGWFLESIEAQGNVYAWDLNTGASLEAGASMTEAGFDRQQLDRLALDQSCRTRSLEGTLVRPHFDAGGVAVSMEPGWLQMEQDGRSWRLPVPAHTRMVAALSDQRVLVQDEKRAWACRDIRPDEPGRLWREDLELRLALALTEAHDDVAALAIAQDLERRRPEMTSLALLQARLLRRSGKTGKAMALANQVLASAAATETERTVAEALLTACGGAVARRVLGSLGGSGGWAHGPYMCNGSQRITRWEADATDVALAPGSTIWQWDGHLAIASPSRQVASLNVLSDRLAAGFQTSLPFTELLGPDEYIPNQSWRSPLLRDNYWLGWIIDWAKPNQILLGAARPNDAQPAWTIAIPVADGVFSPDLVAIQSDHLFIGGTKEVCSIDVAAHTLSWRQMIPSLAAVDASKPAIWPRQLRPMPAAAGSLRVIDIQTASGISVHTLDPGTGAITASTAFNLPPASEHSLLLASPSGRLLLGSHPIGQLNKSELTWVDPATGTTVWTTDAFAPPSNVLPDAVWQHAGRLLLQTSYGFSELDPATGAVLRQVTLNQVAGLGHLCGATLDGEAMVVVCIIGDQFHALRFPTFEALVAWVAAADPNAVRVFQPRSAEAVEPEASGF